MNKIGFIGAGKVGWSFGRHIKENCGGLYEVCGYYSLSADSARAAAEFANGRAFGSPAELAAECDLLFLTVPDGQIAGVWAALAEALPSNRDAALYVAHCSGSLSTEVFEPKPPGVSFGSIHPLQAVPDRHTSYKKYFGAACTIEGDPAFIDFVSGLLKALGNPFSEVDASKKMLYHAACAIICNLSCALTYVGAEVFESCGLDTDFANSSWRSYYLKNAESISDVGAVQALTGPVERCDTATVASHLDILSDDTREIYVLLSRTLVEMAKQKNPSRDYSEMVSLLWKKQ
ncbi:MAG: DUF2520 domain-containing protein [Clostridiales bacterium]|nr:DUF2520 domain-containing protein [Clostridiales bacterium]